MNYFKIDEFDSADGLGIRVGLHVSGCTHKCKGCHSSMYWPFDSGKVFTDKTMEELKTALSKDYIEGLSILGGEPMHPLNIKYQQCDPDSLYIQGNGNYAHLTQNPWHPEVSYLLQLP